MLWAFIACLSIVAARPDIEFVFSHKYYSDATRSIKTADGHTAKFGDESTNTGLPVWLQGEGGVFLDSSSDNNYFKIDLGSHVIFRNESGFSFAFWTRNDVEIDWSTYIAKFTTIDSGNAQSVALALVKSGASFQAFNNPGTIQETDLAIDSSQDGAWNYNLFVFTSTSVDVYRNWLKTTTSRGIIIDDQALPWYVGLRKDVIDPTKRRRLTTGTKNGLIIYSLGFYQRVLIASDLRENDIVDIRATLDSCPLNQSIVADGTCTQCPENCLSCSNAACTSCEPGYYNAFSTCKECPDGCSLCTETECLDCEVTATAAFLKDNGKCLGQTYIFQEGIEPGTGVWPEPITYNLPSRCADLAAFSLQFWVRSESDKNTDYYPDETGDPRDGAVLDMGPHYFYYEYPSLYLGSRNSTEVVQVIEGNPNLSHEWYHIMLSMDSAGRGFLSYFDLEDGSIQNVDISSLSFSTPDTLILNGHHERSHSRHASSFNNIKLWGMLMTRTQLLQQMNIYYQPETAPDTLHVNLIATIAGRQWIPNSVLLDTEDTQYSYDTSPFSEAGAGDKAAQLLGDSSNYYTTNTSGQMYVNNVKRSIPEDGATWKLPFQCEYEKKSVSTFIELGNFLCHEFFHHTFSANCQDQVISDYSGHSLTLGSSADGDSSDPAVQQGQVGLLFDGIDDFASISGINFAASFHFYVWFNPTSLSNSTIFCIKTSHDVATKVITLSADNINILWTRPSHADNNQSQDMAHNFTVDQWQLFGASLLSITPTEHKLQIVSAQTILGTVTFDDNDVVYRDLEGINESRVIIGARYQYLAYGQFFDGTIYELQVGNYFKSPEAMSQLYSLTCECDPQYTCPIETGTCLSDLTPTGEACECDESCLTCGTATDQCTSCHPGYYAENNSCVENCSDDYFGSGNLCISRNGWVITAETYNSVLEISSTSAIKFLHECKDIFVTQDFLGDNSACQWSADHKLLTVYFDQDSWIPDGTELTLQNLRLSDNTEINQWPITVNIAVGKLTDPVARISTSQSRLSSCSDITFSAFGSTGTGLSYSWAFTATKGALQAQNINSRQSTVTRHELKDQDSLRVYLSVTDIYGNTQNTEQLFELEESPIPLIYMENHKTAFTLNPGEDLYYSIDLQPSKCEAAAGDGEQTTANTDELKISWTVELPEETSGLLLDPAILYVTADKLTENSYTFLATVTNGEASTEIRIQVDINHKPTIAVVSGGNRIASVKQDIVLHSDHSTIEGDPTYAWSLSCPSFVCDIPTDIDTTLSNLVIPRNTLSAAVTYVATLQIGEGNFGTAELQMVDHLVPVVSLNPLDRNSLEDLYINGTIQDGTFDYVSQIYFWSVEPPGPVFSHPEFSWDTKVNGISQGENYRFALNVDDYVGNGQAWVDFQSNIRAHGGHVDVFPTTRIRPLETYTQFQAFNWIEDDATLSYALHRGDTRISSRRINGTFASLLIPLGDISDYKIAITDSSGDTVLVPVPVRVELTEEETDEWLKEKLQKYDEEDQALTIEARLANALAFMDSALYLQEIGQITSGRLLQDDDVEELATGMQFYNLMILAQISEIPITLPTAHLRIVLLERLTRNPPEDSDYLANLKQGVSMILQDWVQVLALDSLHSLFKATTRLEMEADKIARRIAHFDVDLVEFTSERAGCLFARDQYFKSFAKDYEFQQWDAGVTLPVDALDGIDLQERLEVQIIVYDYNYINDSQFDSFLSDIRFYKNGSDTQLSLKSAKKLKVKIPATINIFSISEAFCFVWSDDTNWDNNYNMCSGGFETETYSTCECARLGVYAVATDQDQTSADFKTATPVRVEDMDFQVFDLAPNDIEGTSFNQPSGKFNPIYLLIICIIFYIILVTWANGKDREDNKLGKIPHNYKRITRYIYHEHIILSFWLTSKLNGNVNRVSRLFTTLTIILCLLAMGGLSYYNDVNGVSASSASNYTAVDVETAFQMCIPALIVAIILITLFDHDMAIDPLVGYVIASVFNVIWAVAIIFYTLKIDYGPMDAWMISWLVGIIFLFLLSPIATILKFLIERCFGEGLRRDEHEYIVSDEKEATVYDYKIISEMPFEIEEDEDDEEPFYSGSSDFGPEPAYSPDKRPLVPSKYSASDDWQSLESAGADQPRAGTVIDVGRRQSQYAEDDSSFDSPLPSVSSANRSLRATSSSFRSELPMTETSMASSLPPTDGEGSIRPTGSSFNSSLNPSLSHVAGSRVDSSGFSSLPDTVSGSQRPQRGPDLLRPMAGPQQRPGRPSTSMEESGFSSFPDTGSEAPPGPNLLRPMGVQHGRQDDSAISGLSVPGIGTSGISGSFNSSFPETGSEVQRGPNINKPMTGPPRIARSPTVSDSGGWSSYPATDDEGQERDGGPDPFNPGMRAHPRRDKSQTGSSFESSLPVDSSGPSRTGPNMHRAYGRQDISDSHDSFASSLPRSSSSRARTGPNLLRPYQAGPQNLSGTHDSFASSLPVDSSNAGAGVDLSKPFAVQRAQDESHDSFASSLPQGSSQPGSGRVTDSEFASELESLSSHAQRRGPDVQAAIVPGKRHEESKKSSRQSDSSFRSDLSGTSSIAGRGVQGAVFTGNQQRRDPSMRSGTDSSFRSDLSAGSSIGGHGAGINRGVLGKPEEVKKPITSQDSKSSSVFSGFDSLSSEAEARAQSTWMRQPREEAKVPISGLPQQGENVPDSRPPLSEGEKSSQWSNSFNSSMDIPPE